MTEIMSGVRVVAAESWGVVPAATTLLADMGADVIKVEPPDGGDYLRQAMMRDVVFEQPPAANPVFMLWNRGKKNITLNVTKEEGRETLLKLLASADVFATNMRPGALERMRLRYEDLREVNPRLIYVAFNGYGELGEERDRPALGPTALWSRAGLAAHYGEPDEPPHVDRPAWDDSMATLGLLNGILAALYERERSGQGQKVTTSHYQVGVWVNSALIQGRLAGARVVRRLANRESPLRSFYQCSDERWVMISCQTDAHWIAVCKAFGREELPGDPRFATPVERASAGEVLGAIMATEFAKYPAKECITRLTKYGAISEMAYEVDDIINDPIAHINGFFTEIETADGPYRTVAAPFQFSRTPAKARGPVADMGQHTEEVLLATGYTWEDITRFREGGII